MHIEPISDAVGARVTDIDLSKKLDELHYEEIHQAWLEYQVLVFPEQDLKEIETKIADYRKVQKRS